MTLFFPGDDPTVPVPANAFLCVPNETEQETSARWFLRHGPEAKPRFQEQIGGALQGMKNVLDRLDVQEAFQKYTLLDSVKKQQVLDILNTVILP